jgi:hypothetical protein
MYLIDIPFKGCQSRSNHSSIVHAVSYFTCGVNDTGCTVHAGHFKFFCIGSPFWIWFSLFDVARKLYCACGVNDTACIRKDIRIYIRKSFSPLSVAHDRCFSPNPHCFIAITKATACGWKEPLLPNPCTDLWGGGGRGVLALWPWIFA